MILRIQDFAVPAWQIESMELKQGKVHVKSNGTVTIVAGSDKRDFEEAVAAWTAFSAPPRATGINQAAELDESEDAPKPRLVRKKKRPALDTSDE